MSFPQKDLLSTNSYMTASDLSKLNKTEVVEVASEQESVIEKLEAQLAEYQAKEKEAWYSLRVRALLPESFEALTSWGGQAFKEDEYDQIEFCQVYVQFMMGDVIGREYLVKFSNARGLSDDVIERIKNGDREIMLRARFRSNHYTAKKGPKTGQQQVFDTWDAVGIEDVEKPMLTPTSTKQIATDPDDEIQFWDVDFTPAFAGAFFYLFII